MKCHNDCLCASTLHDDWYIDYDFPVLGCCLLTTVTKIDRDVSTDENEYLTGAVPLVHCPSLLSRCHYPIKTDYDYKSAHLRD